jgi:hypothetical protein
MEREVNRSAQKNMLTATRLDEMAQKVPAIVARIHQLADKGQVPEWIVKNMDDKLRTQQTRCRDIVARSLDIAWADLASLRGKSDKEVERVLWTLDSHALQLDSMREAITSDLETFNGEVATHTRPDMHKL